MTPELAALREVDFDWARQLQSVWQDPPYNVELLNGEVEEDIFAGFRRLLRPGSGSGLGRVIVGPAGSGKTHLVGNLRKRVWEAEGWFVLLDIVGITDFWRTAALGFINSLHQRMPNNRPQYENVLLRVLKSLPPAAVESVSREAGGFQRGDTVAMGKRFVGLLRAAHPGVAMQHREVVRAFILLRDDTTANAAYSWLQGLDIEAGERKELGFEGPPPAAAELVRGMSWFMSLAGPTMIAADQLDAIVTAANISAGSGSDTGDETETKARAIIETLAGGLMDLRDVSTRSVTVVTCLPDTWEVLKNRALKPAIDRFMEPVALQPPRDSAVVRRIIGDRVSSAYKEVGFQPLYSTWPFRPSAVESATGMPPRLVLMRCEAHRRRCISAGAVSECDSLDESASTKPEPEPRPDGGLDAEFRRRSDEAETTGLLEGEDDSKALRVLLADALALYVRQTDTPEDVDLVLRRDPNEQKPTLHGRLVFAFRAEGEREQHFCFRVLDHSNAIAFQSRLRAAMTASGIDAKLPFRHLFVLRSGPPPSGPVTKKLLAEFHASGGVVIRPGKDDLRALVALRDMDRHGAEGFEAWLGARKPLSGLALFKATGLSPPPVGPAARAGAENGGSLTESQPSGPVTKPATDTAGPAASKPKVMPENLSPASEPTEQPDEPPKPKRTEFALPRAPEPPAIPVGRRLEAGGEGRAESLRADLLPRHTAIIAGSGSGKTVLLRRIVEEAALLGIPAIVLDTNNDLARLGDPWPERPASFSDADAQKAEQYRAGVEVVVWTPGLASGNPLALSLLPDFAVLDDAEERNQAVQMALATLVPFVGATGAKGPLKEGVLADALRSFAIRAEQQSQADALGRLIALLDDLPEDVSQIGAAEKHAREMADRLKAAISTNPLLKGAGQSLDPHTLYAGSDGKTRVSVINFSGLPSDAARQSFVNQLQMALFTWIRRNPSPTGRLYAMDEAQNFAPAGKSTPASASTLALAAQARKYGLGMIFATQVPKGIDNKIVSNSTTHFYGRQSAPVTIHAARDMMAAKGGGGDDVGRLTRGQFYYSTEGVNRPIKLNTPLCLTFHPANPLSPEEVQERARKGRQA